jgi:hypothetical protein
MLEMDCVYNGLRYQFEVGETEDQMIAYFKNKRPINESIELLRTLTGRFGLTPHVLAKKVDQNGNVIKVKFLYDGSWD